MSYHEIMPEDTGEVLSHRDKMRQARQNLAKRRDEKQIGFMQEALRRERVVGKPISPEESEDVGYDELQMALFKAFVEIGHKAEPGTNPFKTIKGAKSINEMIGPLLSDQIPLKNLVIPNKNVLLKLKNNPRYDSAVVQQLIDMPHEFRGAYNYGLNALAYGHEQGWSGADIGTVGDLRAKTFRDLAAKRTIGADKANFLQTAFG